MPNGEKTKNTIWPTYWAVLLAFFLFLQSVASAVTIPRGSPPDEMAHISYIIDAANSSVFLPNYTDGEILNSGKKNYLGHPPLYYSVLGVACRALGLDPLQDYKLLRILSSSFVALGFFFWLLAARNFGIGTQSATMLTLACCAIPMFGYLSGSINNDTLVYLGVSTWFLGLSRFKLESTTTDTKGVMLFTLGILMVFLTKATAAAFLTFFLAAILVLRWRDFPSIVRNPLYARAAAAIVIVCGLYYVYTTVKFGTPMPKPSALYDVSPPPSPVSIFQFGFKYAHSMWDRLPVVMSHASISPIADRATPFFYIMMLLPVVGWLVSRPQATSRGAIRTELLIGDVFAFALVCTIFINIYVTYSAYLRTGLYAGWQPRYFYFVIPGVWLLMSTTRPSVGLQAAVAAGFGACVCVVFWSGVPFLLTEQQPSKVQPSIAVIHMPAVLGASKLSINADSSSDTVSSHLDEMRLEDRKLFLRGWSFDSASSRPTQRIWILANQKYLGSAPTSIERPDVAKALNAPSALRTGFSILVKNVPTSIRTCEITLLAEMGDGTLAVMRAPDCAPITPGD